jgi:hypothetical protein
VPTMSLWLHLQRRERAVTMVRERHAPAILAPCGSGPVAGETRTNPRHPRPISGQVRTLMGAAAYLRISSRLMMSRYRCGATRLR